MRTVHIEVIRLHSPIDDLICSRNCPSEDRRIIRICSDVNGVCRNDPVINKFLTYYLDFTFICFPPPANSNPFS